MTSSRQAQIITVLERAPEGLSTSEICREIGLEVFQVSTLVSKMAMYGRLQKVRIPGQIGLSNAYRWSIKTTEGKP